MKLERFYPHEQGISDAMRLPGHVDWLKANKDPIKLFNAKMSGTHEVAESEVTEIDEDIDALVDEAVVEAKAAPPVPVSELLTDVYHTYP